MGAITDPLGQGIPLKGATMPESNTEHYLSDTLFIFWAKDRMMRCSQSLNRLCNGDFC